MVLFNFVGVRTGEGIRDTLSGEGGNDRNGDPANIILPFFEMIVATTNPKRTKNEIVCRCVYFFWIFFFSSFLFVRGINEES